MWQYFLCVFWLIFCSSLFWHFIILRKFQRPDILENFESNKDKILYGRGDQFIVNKTIHKNNNNKKINRYILYYGNFTIYSKLRITFPKVVTIILIALMLYFTVWICTFLVSLLQLVVWAEHFNSNIWFFAIMIFPINLFIFYYWISFINGVYRGTVLHQGIIDWTNMNVYIKYNKPKYKKVFHYIIAYGKVFSADSKLSGSLTIIGAIATTVLFMELIVIY